MERDHEQKPPLNRHAEEEHVELPLSHFQELVYELQNRQVELELQNESLREIQLELAESQRRSFELFDLAPVGYLTLDVRGNIMEANLMASHLLDVSRKQLVGMPLLGFVPMKARNAFMDYMKRARVAETGQDMELVLKKGAGGETEVQIRCVSMWDGKEVSEGMRVIIIDISKRKAAERALRWREEQSNQILNAMVDLICYCDGGMHVLWANDTFLRMVGRRLHEVAGDFCYRLLYGRDAPCYECRGMQALKKGVTQPFVPAMAPRGADAENTHWECCIVPLADPSGSTMRFLVVLRDVTELKNSMNRIRALTGELLQAQERERHMIAGELHDGVAQDLAAHKMTCLGMMAQWEDLPREVTNRISKMAGDLEKTIHGVRDLAYDLRPPDLDPDRIEESIGVLCEETAEASGLAISFSSAGMEHAPLNSDVAIGLYRLVQEGIRNIRKHARASRVQVRMIAAFPNIHLFIEDNGVGFDVEERRRKMSKEKRMGLRSMEERVRLLSGTFALRSEPGKGTTLRITLPLKEV